MICERTPFHPQMFAFGVAAGALIAGGLTYRIMSRRQKLVESRSARPRESTGSCTQSMKKIKKIAIGTTNQCKVAAVEQTIAGYEALQEATLIPHKVSSGIDEQVI